MERRRGQGVSRREEEKRGELLAAGSMAEVEVARVAKRTKGEEWMGLMAGASTWLVARAQHKPSRDPGVHARANTVLEHTLECNSRPSHCLHAVERSLHCRAWPLAACVAHLNGQPRKLSRLFYDLLCPVLWAQWGECGAKKMLSSRGV
eukprot:193211-Pleurochrysis_carterae.AAC.2